MISLHFIKQLKLVYAYCSRIKHGAVLYLINDSLDPTLADSTRGAVVGQGGRFEIRTSRNAVGGNAVDDVVARKRRVVVGDVVAWSGLGGTQVCVALAARPAE